MTITDLFYRTTNSQPWDTTTGMSNELEAGNTRLDRFPPMLDLKPEVIAREEEVRFYPDRMLAGTPYVAQLGDSHLILVKTKSGKVDIYRLSAE